jgi:hypothetical protein
MNLVVAALLFLISVGDPGRLGENTVRIGRSVSYVGIRFPYFKASKRVLSTLSGNIYNQI